MKNSLILFVATIVLLSAVLAGCPPPPARASCRVRRTRRSRTTRRSRSPARIGATPGPPGSIGFLTETPRSPKILQPESAEDGWLGRRRLPGCG